MSRMMGLLVASSLRPKPAVRQALAPSPRRGSLPRGPLFVTETQGRAPMSKKSLNETEICQNYITPAIAKAGWDPQTQIRREFAFTAGRVIVRGKIAARGKRKRADYLLFYESNLPLAVVEAKDNNHAIGGGLQQALEYAN